MPDSITPNHSTHPIQIASEARCAARLSRVRRYAMISWAVRPDRGVFSTTCQYNSSGFTEPVRLVVRDALQWSTVWAQINAGVSPLPARPDIDFSREMVIVAAMGIRNSGGFGILIDEATAIGADGVAVTVRSIAPGSRCFVTGVLTAPVDVARLPRRNGVVQFTERTQMHNCE
jgi:hypothetical protein